MHHQNNRGDFSQGSIPHNILNLAVPIMAAEIIHVLYNLVDRMYIGHIPEVGTAALTGVGITLPLVTLISAFASLCGSGGAPLMAIARGKGDIALAQRIEENAFTMLLLFSAVLTAAFCLWRVPALSLMGADSQTLPYALEYFDIYLWGTGFVMISLGMNPFINAQGFSRIGMWTVLIGAVSNAILDPILIFGLHLGVRGAGIATVFSQCLSAFWAWHFLSGEKAPLRLRRLCLDPRIIGQILSLGITGFSFKITNSITQAVVNFTLRLWGGALGTLYIGAMSVINSLREVASQPASGLTGGAQPVISYNYGARLYDRVRDSIQFMVRSTLLYNFIAWIILMFFPVPLVSIFVSDKELVQFCIPCLRIYFGAFFMMSLQSSGQNTYVALNKPKYAVFFSLFRKVILVLPLTILLPQTSLGVMGVFWAELISQIVGASICYGTMRILIRKKLK